VSRALKKINAVKSVGDRGNSIYTLQTFAQGQQVASPPLNVFESLVHCIDYNGHLIVVHTKPGTAMTVAKFIDDKKFEQIMGTVAGDDTIIIAPKNVSLIPILADHVKVYLRV
jgi:transcriptional regulator of arginine metabolism